MCSSATTTDGRSESRSKIRRSSSGGHSNGGGGGTTTTAVFNTENKQDTTSAAHSSDDIMPLPHGASSSPPLAGGARPSRLMLRVSICFALLSACGGWVLSGGGGERLATLARISDQVRVGLVSPWVSRKKEKKVCVRVGVVGW